MMDACLIHCAHMKQICGLIRLATAESIRFEINMHDVAHGEEEPYEYWKFSFPYWKTSETLNLLSATCLCCGNYLCSSKANRKHAQCLCPYEYESDEAVETRRNREIERNLGFALMNDYDAFGEFVDLLLPVGAPDRLCEDVIGEISRFLV